jgi:uncharacterized membrane protein
VNAEYDDSPGTRQRLYEHTKNELISKQLANSTTYDNSILTLSSAFLGLSIAFIKDVVAPISNAILLYALYSAWICFCLAIISTLISFMIGQAGLKSLLESAERYYIHGDSEAFEVSVKVSRRIDIANYVHGVMFVLGTILIIVFVIANFSRVANMQNPNAAKLPIDQRGQPTNTFQKIPTSPATATASKTTQTPPAPTGSASHSKNGT